MTVLTGADPTGVVDATAAINTAIGSLPAEHAELVIPPGRYRISDGLTISGKTHLTIHGPGAVLDFQGGAVSSAGAKSLLHVTGCNHFRIDGLTITDTDRTHQYNGLRVSASSDGTIDGVRVVGVRWTGISVYDTSPSSSVNVSISGCTVIDARFGVSTNGEDVRVVGNHIAMYWPSTAEAVAKSGVWSTPSDYYDGILVLAGARRTIVSANTVFECGQAGIYSQDCTDLVVAGNTITGCQLRGIEIDGDTGTAVGVTIVGNTVTDCVGHINLVRAQQVTVAANRVENSNPARPVSGIAVNTGSADVAVSGNHVRQAHPTYPAVYVDPAATGVSLALNSVDAGVRYQTPADTVIVERCGSGQVKVVGKLIATAGVGVANSASASTLGTVTRKIEVFGSSGQSIGYLPVYGSIT